MKINHRIARGRFCVAERLNEFITLKSRWFGNKENELLVILLHFLDGFWNLKFFH